MSDMKKLVFRDMPHTTDYYDREATKRPLPGRDKDTKNDLNNEERRILSLGTKLEGKRIEKIIIPSNIFDIWPKLEVLLGLNSRDILIL